MTLLQIFMNVWDLNGVQGLVMLVFLRNGFCSKDMAALGLVKA